MKKEIEVQATMLESTRAIWFVKTARNCWGKSKKSLPKSTLGKKKKG